ncbi:MAG: hypothetical protein EP299_12435 [Acidobacteria bacterium]|nr:MAG: hypothetical protein EP299_12435 [Acidobacteriota bacterium]
MKPTLKSALFCGATVLGLLLLTVGAASATSIQVQITNGDDDVEGGSSGSGDLDFDGDEIIGLRFPGVAVPQGAFITSATIDLQADELDQLHRQGRRR